MNLQTQFQYKKMTLSISYFMNLMQRYENNKTRADYAENMHVTIT